METALRAALIGWLRADPALTALLNTITEEAPSRTAPPWLALVASASGDWSTKDQAGREVRVAFEIHARGDDPAAAAAVTRAVEARIVRGGDDHVPAGPRRTASRQPARGAARVPFPAAGRLISPERGADPATHGGGGVSPERSTRGLCPSATFRVVPLPLQGRIHFQGDPT
jgi:hypothetical protein